MTEVSASAYDRFKFESAEQYIQTVVLVDDRIYEIVSGKIPSPLVAPQSASRTAATKSTSSSAVNPSIDTEAIDDNDDPEEVSFLDLQKSFAQRGIVCSLYQPESTASFNEESEVYKLCSNADVVIVDWDLGDALGAKATELVGCLIEQSQTVDPQQLRLVMIYTLDPDLRSVAEKIRTELGNRIGSDTVEGEETTLELTTKTARVVVRGKVRNASHQYNSEERIPASRLACYSIKEFSELASGLLQGVALRGIAKLRDNNRRILSRFNKDLDLAFLIHRAFTLPDEAFEQVITLLTDELNSVLEDTISESSLGTSSSIMDILNDWCDTHWEVNENCSFNIGEGADGPSFVKDVFCNGPNLQVDYSRITRSQVSGLINNSSNPPIWNIGNINKFAEYLLGSSQEQNCNEKLGSLMSQKIKYGDSQRELHLGVIVKELCCEKRYLLCLQPVCDSVRMGDSSKSFMFCVLNEVENTNSKMTHCVIDVSGQVVRLSYKPKVPSVCVSSFRSTSEVVSALRDQKERYVFIDEAENKYEWIAELKTEHAQRAAEQFARELSRVGLTESEWLRLKAK